MNLWTCLYNCPVNTIISCRNQISYNQFKSSPFQVSHCQPVVSSKMLCKDLLNATDLALVLILRWATFLPFCHVRRLVGRAAPPTSSVPSLMNPWAKSVHGIIDLKSRNIETSVVVAHTHMTCKIVYRYRTSETSRDQTIEYNRYNPPLSTATQILFHFVGPPLQLDRAKALPRKQRIGAKM